MADNDRIGTASVWTREAFAALASLPRAEVLRVAAGIAVVTIGLATVWGTTWALGEARQTMQGRMAVYAQYNPRASMVHVGFIEIAENTP